MPVVGQISVGDGATFTPSVSNSGVISWSNDKNLPNPASVDIAGVVQTAISGVYLPTAGGTVTGNLTVNGTITGNLSGNATTATTATTALSATTATSATNDGNGNVITATYLPLAGGTLTGNLTENNDLIVNGNANLNTLSTTGDATVGGDFDVVGNSTLASVSVSGNTTVTDLTADNITVTNDLSVNGASTFTGNITAGADVTVTGDISANDITASGDITADDVTANGNLSVVGNATLSGVSTAVTPAAEDNSTKIATTAYVQTEIKSIETDVTINEKRISNIEKLLEGNLYDYQTDSNSAYTKTVPSGAMPWASLDSVGGRTVVWNQLVQDPNMTDATKWSTDTIPANFSFSVSSNTLKVERLAGTNNFVLVSKPNTTKRTANHKFLYSFTLRGDVSRSIRFYYGSASDTINATTTFEHYSGICTPTTGGGDIGISVLASQMGVGGYIEVQNYCIFDLTLMYGSGNEPTTVQEFTAQFPAQYYAFNNGTLLSAGVTEVVSVGKNLAYYGNGVGVPSDTATSNTTKRTFEVGKYVVGLTYNNYYTPANVTQYSVTDNLIQVTNSTVQYGVGIPFNCVGGASYNLNFTATNGACRIGWYAEDGTYISGTIPSSILPTTITAPANARQCVVIMYGATANVQATFSNIIVTEGSTATYVPAKAPISYPIPAEIRNLEGYGWSAGTAYNYVDFERKKYVQNVGRVDMGSLTWYSTSGFFYTILNVMATPPNSNVMSSRYLFGGIKSDSQIRNADDKQIFRQSGNYSICVKDLSYETADALKTSLLGVYLYYELATPIEVDISAYLTDDNLISVEAGGTITFPNSNGNDYRIPIPSSETYMVDLQASLGG